MTIPSPVRLQRVASETVAVVGVDAIAVRGKLDPRGVHALLRVARYSVTRTHAYLIAPVLQAAVLRRRLSVVTSRVSRARVSIVVHCSHTASPL